MKQKKSIGINVKIPSKACDDKHCPFHGDLKLRGRIFTGEIVSKDMHKTAKIVWTRLNLLRKFERYEKRKSGLKVHNPLCIDAKVGEIVRVAETKPISKTKHFVIIERVAK